MLTLVLVATLTATPSPVTGMKPVTGRENLLVSGVEVPPGDFRDRAVRYLNDRGASFQSQAPDGKSVLIATRFAQVTQLHWVKSPLGARTQLTFGDEPVSSGRFSPDEPGVLYYLQDVGGGEAYQVFRLDTRTGRAERITDGTSRHTSLVLARRGGRLAYASPARNGRDIDVYWANVAEPRAAQRLTEEPGAWSPITFSPDGTQLLVRNARSVADVDLHLVEVATGRRTQLTPKGEKGSLAGAAFSPDGRSVYLVTDRYGDYSAPYRVALERPAAEPERVGPPLRWNVEALTVAPSGSRVVISVNENGFSKLYLLEAGRRWVPLPVPPGVVGALSFPAQRADRLTFSLQSATAPSDVWQLDLGSRRLMRWTQSENGGLPQDRLVEPRLVRYPSTDQVTVPALLYLPPGAPAGSKAPVVVIFHGGPESQSRPTFNALTQLLAAELGIAVLVPNVRGSSGYGKAYREMDDGIFRERSLADVGATFDFIAAQPELDGDRVGVYGVSYGGYLTLAAATYFPERVRAAVDVVGISNIASFLESTQAYRRDLRRVEYGDERDPAQRRVLDRISPLHSADKIRAALYVLQGKNDPRVAQSEAEQIVQAVRKNGREVWYLLALDEGHGFKKKPNRDYALMTSALFFHRHLRRAHDRK
jgi:dipeptidyl aminopeptidase/acylaminoacyl peptidase